MFASPRVIAIDDDLTHLTGLAKGLNRHGVACLQIHFTGDPTGITSCPDVRIIFADLHLGTGGLGPDPTIDFGVISGLLRETIRPVGPYFIVLWTMYPDYATQLQTFLVERLTDVAKPLDVLSLAKADHLDQNGNVRNEDLLVQTIGEITRAVPQIGVLVDWESRVLEAAGSTVSSLLELASTDETVPRAIKMGRLLKRLGTEAVGEAHLESDRFRAVNEALLPILADRIANLRLREGDEDIWQAALELAGDAQDLSAADTVKLNGLVHIADSSNADGSERGVVVLLPALWRGQFDDTFGIDETSGARDHFRCKDFAPDDNRFHWVLVQCQAACDHAQSHPGTIPWYLGLDLPEANKRSGTPPAGLWLSPAFKIDDEIRRLHVSAYFMKSHPRGAIQDATPIYRLREQLLNELIYRLHSHGARPGMMSFRP